MKIIDCGISATVKHRIMRNDKRWLVTNMLIVTIFLGYILLDRNSQQERFDNYKAESVAKCDAFKDSLIAYCNTEYDIVGRCGRAKK